MHSFSGAPEGCTQRRGRGLTAVVMVEMHPKTKVIKSLIRPSTQGQLHRNPAVSLATLCHISTKSLSFSTDLLQLFASYLLLVLVLAPLCWKHSDFARCLSGLLSTPVPAGAKGSCLHRAWNTERQVVSYWAVTEPRLPVNCQGQRCTEALGNHGSGRPSVHLVLPPSFAALQLPVSCCFLSGVGVVLLWSVWPPPELVWLVLP